MINWFTSLRIDEQVPCGCGPDEYLKQLERLLARQRPRRLEIQDSCLEFSGPIMPPIRGIPNLHGVRRLRVSANASNSGIRVTGDAELAGPLHMFAVILVLGTFMIAMPVGSPIADPAVWLSAALVVLFAGILGAAGMRGLLLILVRYHLMRAGESP